MPAVNLRQIEIFHAVMTTGNLTEAAQMLHTSQPTVSRELARFEKVLELKLFERTRGRLHPTVQGLRLFEEVQRSWYGLDRIVSAAESLREFRQGELSIVCLPVFSQSFLPTLLQPFLARYPEVNLTIVPQESPLLEEWLSAQRHDLGLTETLSTPAGTARTELLSLDEVCVLPAGHRLAGKRRSVYKRLALYDLAIERKTLAGPHLDIVSNSDKRRGYFPSFSAFIKPSKIRAQVHKFAYRAAGFVYRHVLQILANRIKKHDTDRFRNLMNHKSAQRRH